MADRDDSLLRRVLTDLRQKIDRIGTEHDDLQELVSLLEQQIGVEQAFRRRHEVKLAEVGAMLEQIRRRLELVDDAGRS